MASKLVARATPTFVLLEAVKYDEPVAGHAHLGHPAAERGLAGPVQHPARPARDDEEALADPGEQVAGPGPRRVGHHLGHVEEPPPGVEPPEKLAAEPVDGHEPARPAEAEAQLVAGGGAEQLLAADLARLGHRQPPGLAALGHVDGEDARVGPGLVPDDEEVVRQGGLDQLEVGHELCDGCNVGYCVCVCACRSSVI